MTTHLPIGAATGMGGAKTRTHLRFAQIGTSVRIRIDNGHKSGAVVKNIKSLQCDWSLMP